LIYKLLAVGGGNFNLAALTSGQLSAAFLVVPLVYAAGLRTLGFQRLLLQLSTYWRLSAAGRNETAADGALLKRGAAGKSLAFANKGPAVDFLAKEIQMTPELARKAWDYYISNRIWHPNAELNLERIKFALEILAEQTKVAPPDPLRCIDYSYLQQTIKELGEQ
jgi:hypothetical protein